jgi:hypothetical protein
MTKLQLLVGKSGFWQDDESKMSRGMSEDSKLEGNRVPRAAQSSNRVIASATTKKKIFARPNCKPIQQKSRNQQRCLHRENCIPQEVAEQRLSSQQAMRP